MIHRSALDYLNVRNVPDLLSVLQTQAQESLRVRQQSLAVAPAFAPGGMFGEQLTWSATLPPRAAVPEPDDPTAVFVVHGRDDQAKAALWAFLSDLGLHPLDWEDDLVAQTGQGSPFIGQVLDAAFAHAQAVIVLMTPDDAVRLHKDLVRPGEQSFERRAACQPRPNVLFEAGMAFGYCPSRTILVEIGSLRPISDLGGRHTIRLGVEDTLRALARRLEVAGCPVNRSNDSWLNVQRFSDLQARARRP
jgi:predicted nucleotide-binding protein